MSNADTNLMNGIVEEKTDFGTSFKLSGEPWANALTAAVVANYTRVTERPRPTEEDLVSKIGQKVTLVLAGENMLGSQGMTAREGTLFAGSKTGLAILPKGKRSKGYVVDPKNVLDIFDGYNTLAAIGTTAEVRATYPNLRNLTPERLASLPGEGEMGDEITLSLAVFGTWRMPWAVATDAIWLIGEYWPEHDICDRGVLLIRPEHGVSEHGSVYGQQLLRGNVGVVVDFTPIPYGEAIALCDADFDEASAAVFGRVAIAA